MDQMPQQPDAAHSSDSPSPAPRGAGAGRRRAPGRGWWTATAVLAVGCLGVGTWVAPSVAQNWDRLTGTEHQNSRAGHASSSASASDAQDSVRDLPSDAPVPSEQQIDEAMSTGAEGFSGGSVAAQVADAETGKVLWSQDAEKEVKPASNLKILTALSLLSHSDPSSRYSTSAYEGSEKDRMVLVAGGDTLLSDGAGEPTKVLGRAGLGDLAEQTVEKLADEGRSGRITVDLDESAFQGPATNDAWSPEDVETGYVTGVHPIALWDHHTARPSDPESTADRPQDGARDAWTAYLDRLNDAGRSHGLRFEEGEKTSEATDTEHRARLASVESATVLEQAQYMMDYSDNQLAEVLGRNAAVAAGRSGSEDEARDLVRTTLEDAGIPTEKLRNADLCGLSGQDRLTASLLVRVLSTAQRSQDNAALLDSVLPVAGGSGTLATRFDDADEAAGRGWARAKTGTLLDVNSLSGTTVTRDGRTLVYSIVINDVTDAAGAKDLLDRSVAGLTRL